MDEGAVHRPVDTNCTRHPGHFVNGVVSSRGLVQPWTELNYLNDKWPSELSNCYLLLLQSAILVGVIDYPTISLTYARFLEASKLAWFDYGVFGQALSDKGATPARINSSCRFCASEI